jgi:hypothetical protein
VEAPEERRCTWSIKDQNRIGLVNRSGVSIHHVVNRALNCPVAFIFSERAQRSPMKANMFPREPDVKSLLPKRAE